MVVQVLRTIIPLAVGSFFVVFAFPVIASKHNVKGAAGSSTQPSEAHHPKGWRFTLPKGDPNKGRATFEKFECYYCHEVRGETFPYPVETAPELSQMGALHPVEFFAESIMNPNAVVPKEYREPDGTSPMTNFAGKMTVQELIDVSAYVASLRQKGAPKSVSGEGKIVALLPDKAEIVLEHGALRGFMEAMTMGYAVNPVSLLKNVKPGDSVRFTIDTEKRAITKIEKLKK